MVAFILKSGILQYTSFLDIHCHDKKLKGGYS